MKNTYTVYLGGNAIAWVLGHDDAYACFEAAKTIAECTGREASLVWDDTHEVVAFYSPFEDEDDWDADADECGFDPYEGCYTYDC